MPSYVASFLQATDGSLLDTTTDWTWTGAHTFSAGGAVFNHDGTASDIGLRVQSTGNSADLQIRGTGSNRTEIYTSAILRLNPVDGYDFYQNGAVLFIVGANYGSDFSMIPGGSTGKMQLGLPGLSQEVWVNDTLKGRDQSTTSYRDVWAMNSFWIDSTDATRKARIDFSVYDTAAREFMSAEASGTAAKLSFFGVAPVTRPQVTASGVSAADLLTALDSLGILESI